MRWPVVAPDRADQGSCRALSLQVAVVMWKIFYRKRHVGVVEELAVLVAVEIEGRGDECLGSDRFPHPPRQFGLRARDAAYGHGPVQAEIDAVERFAGLDLGDHPADEGFIGVSGDPSGSHIGLWPQR